MCSALKIGGHLFLLLQKKALKLFQNRGAQGLLNHCTNSSFSECARCTEVTSHSVCYSTSVNCARQRAGCREARKGLNLARRAGGAQHRSPTLCRRVVERKMPSIGRRKRKHRRGSPSQSFRRSHSQSHTHTLGAHGKA